MSRRPITQEKEPFRTAEIDALAGVSMVSERHLHFVGQMEELPSYPCATSIDELREPVRVRQRLDAIDWSFTHDETGYLTHDIHPYPAKFIPQIPGHLVSMLSMPGELVLDPFGGSGTTALEAVRIGRRALSVDANPISALIGKVKTTTIGHRADIDLRGIRSFVSSRLSSLPDDPAGLVEEYRAYVPDIANRHKWFPDTSCGELALLRRCVETAETGVARDVAALALSRTVLHVSFQDSETRYASRPREIRSGETLSRFLNELDTVLESVRTISPLLRYGVARFVTGDTRSLDPKELPDESVDLIVTSPPYGNATDYHLYHRFRLLWLGYDPKLLGRQEIGSHLRHQREKSGFDKYLAEMSDSLRGCSRVLRNGRYAALVVGDAVYQGVTYQGAEALAEAGGVYDLETVAIIERPVHRTKRSFVAAGRRATSEKILVLRKKPRVCKVALGLPPYRLWPYEESLRSVEIRKLLEASSGDADAGVVTRPDALALPTARRLTFSHLVEGCGAPERTWQAILENGFVQEPSARKDPKYATHGLHPYKGKFYPQLAKALLNVSDSAPGGLVLDPFCGSGTTLLESYLNGMRACGCDMNPLAAKIAKAKVGVLALPPAIVVQAVETINDKLDGAPSSFGQETDQFPDEALEEILSWFPEPVVYKANWLLRCLRNVSCAVLRDFFEVVFSSIVRDVSQQEPTDLRIRRRIEPIGDADVLGLFRQNLLELFGRVEKFWKVRGYSPFQYEHIDVVEGDSRDWETYTRLGLEKNSANLVLTSPPYATALPYIDTDRLSILLLWGLTSSTRRPLEQHLTGSREILTGERRSLDAVLKAESGREDLPCDVLLFLTQLLEKMETSDVGFRRRNLPALLLRFFRDMRLVLANCQDALVPGGQAMIVIGDNITKVNGTTIRIPTTDYVQSVALQLGFELQDRIPITVTTENMLHIKNAITENVVLVLQNPTGG